MDNFDPTTGVIDSWDLLYPVSHTFVQRNIGSVKFSNINLRSTSASLYLKESSYNPALNNISAGYYPLLSGFYKGCRRTYERPLIQITVCPKSSITTTNTHKRRKRTKNKTLDNSPQSKEVYIVLPKHRKEKVYFIEASNAEIFKDITDNKLLSECIKKSYFEDMNKIRKKSPDKAKEKEHPLKTIPECSPGCAYMNLMNKTKNVTTSPPSPQSPVRSIYEFSTKVESEVKKQTTNKQSSSQKRTPRSPDRISLKSDDEKTNSPTRSSQQKTRVYVYQSENQKKGDTSKSPERFSLRSKRSIESVIAEERRRSPERYNKKSGDSTSRPDRIRIIGRLGLTKDDKCVLKCDATLNDKPILTQFQGADCALLPQCYQACTEECRKQRDVKVQAKESPIGSRFYSAIATGKESQGTQVDFQMVFSTATRRREDSGRGKVKQQCACVSTVDNVSNMYDNNEDTSITVKKKQTPLIVISVYSKSDDSKTSDELNQTKTKPKDQKKEIKKVGRSRSSSPTKSGKKIVDKKSEGRINASTSKKTVRETVRKTTRTKLSQTQSRSTERTSSAKTKTESRTTKSKSLKAQKTPPQSRRSSSPQTKQEEANITEQMKRALIDDFTKQYTEQMQRQAHVEIPLQTKHNVSNITIDIEGDSDYYNVKLEQDPGINTELTVRKSPRGGSKLADFTSVAETDTTSLENFLYMPENEHRKRSFSQTLMYDGTDLTMNSEKEVGKALNVKDSIEISHRRETKASVHLNDNHENYISQEVDTKYLAQPKHFQGDDCSVPNPVTRDREIQKLLGIDKRVMRYTTKSSQTLPTNVAEKSSQRGSMIESSSAIMATEKETYSKQMTANFLYDVSNTGIIRQLHTISTDNNIKKFYQSNSHRANVVVLNRRQYDNVKRRIFRSLIVKHHLFLTRAHYIDRRLRENKPSKTKSVILHYDKECQTVSMACAMTSDVNTYTISKSDDDGLMFNNNNNNDKISPSFLTLDDNSDSFTLKVVNPNIYYSRNVRTVYIAREHTRADYNQIKADHLTKAESVKNIQYTRMDKKHRVRFSSSDCVNANYVSESEVKKKDSYSVHTIFKCHRKSLTPNLGASANSLCDSNENNDSRFRLKLFEDSLHDIKSKKPFLRRLMSCLVFKMSPVSQKEGLKPKARIENGSPPCSFDSSYYISSLGAIEMSSSMYDTSASFYTDHTVAGAKIKRGFLTSVRGFLSRKN